jgi:translation initiation factor 3 subunit I
MFDTHQCERIGVFEIKEACKSISLTKDSKYLFAAPTTKGIHVYNVADGKLAAATILPGNFTKHIALSYSDKQVLVIYEVQKVNYIRIYNVADIMKGDNENIKPTLEIKAADGDIAYTDCVWGPLDKSLYISTNRGQVIFYDLGKKRIENEQHIHKDEIFSLSITHDFTMLTTSSRDGTAKILNPRDLSTVRQFVYGKPCRSATISPLFDDPTHQKFHIL